MGKDCREPRPARSWGGNLAGTDVEAGLPNITGKTGDTWVWGYETYTGAFVKGHKCKQANGTPTDVNDTGLGFDASKSNPIYGASETVQPPAHIVTFWKRIE